MTKINGQQPTESKIKVGDKSAQLNHQTDLRPQTNYANTNRASEPATSKQQQPDSKKQYPPTPAWFFTLGTKPDAWGPSPGHMFREK